MQRSTGYCTVNREDLGTSVGPRTLETAPRALKVVSLVHDETKRAAWESKRKGSNKKHRALNSMLHRLLQNKTDFQRMITLRLQVACRKTENQYFYP